MLLLEVTQDPPVDPNPWNPVTITTAIIAVAGLLLSGWNAYRSWKKDRPKVHWQQTWEVENHEYLVFKLANRGRGVAEDVHLFAFDTERGWQTEQAVMKRMEFGENIVRRFRVAGDVPPDKLNLRVEWSQLPDLPRRRTKKYYWVKPTE
ncbi:MAG: hypothetical protein KF739_04605 [Cryobacterium sp.]|nr:hypothetical protein [Cryobacterium sp.]